MKVNWSHVRDLRDMKPRKKNCDKESRLAPEVRQGTCFVFTPYHSATLCCRAKDTFRLNGPWTSGGRLKGLENFNSLVSQGFIEILGKRCSACGGGGEVEVWYGPPPSAKHETKTCPFCNGKGIRNVSV